MKVSISRPINGITINGNEYLLDDEGNVRIFESTRAAVAFLITHGVTKEELDSYTFHGIEEVTE